MHLSKNTLYLGIIFYSLGLLIFQDYAPMLHSVGTISLLFLIKMGIDVIFAGMAGIRLVGPAFFAQEDDEDDEVTIHPEDLQFSDTALFGFFMLNVGANLAYHGYLTINTQDAVSFWFSIWTMADCVILFAAFILFKHAQAVQRRLAKESRRLADAKPRQRASDAA